MKINNTILNARKDLGMTQEQIAERLGVTASAVSKWEKGSAYPDITILAPLARLLGMDLNALLSFKKNLTPAEIGEITRELVHEIEQYGYDTGFELAMKIIHEYSSCDLLVSNIAATLQGAQMLYSVKDKEKYEGRIIELYKSLLDSED